MCRCLDLKRNYFYNPKFDNKQSLLMITAILDRITRILLCFFLKLDSFGFIKMLNSIINFFLKSHNRSRKIFYKENFDGAS